MATTFVEFTGDGNATKPFSFPSIQESDIKVEVDGTLKSSGTHYNISSYTTTGGGNVVFTSGNIPSSPSLIRIFRDTDVDNAKATYTAGASVKAEDLNDNHKQLLFAAQEEQNQLIVTAKIRSGQVTSDKIKDGTIVNADINASADIENTKIADGLLNAGITVNSANIVDGSIVDADVNASAAIAGTKISPNFGSQVVQTTGNIVVGGTVDGRNVSVDGTKLDTIETGATGDQTNAEIRTAVEAANDSNVFTDADHTKLNGIQALATDDQTAAEIKTLLQASKLTAAEIAEGALDGRYYTETESEARFLRQDSSETIASGVAWSNSDAFVATTAAINARIIDLVDEVGGFDAIANETSFPTTNPQGATGQSAILSIAATSTTLTPSGTTVTIADGAGTGNTVTITGVPAVIPQGFGFLVESTSTTHTYTFHRQVPKASDVSAVASNITNVVSAGANSANINAFAKIYQISANQPSARNDGSSLQVGDLWFNSSNADLRVWNGSAFSTITPSQSVLNDVAIVSGAITFQEDLGLITDPVTTGSSNGSLDIVADALEDEITIAVTVANYNGVNKFVLDGDTANPAKTLSLHKGWTYTFDQSHSTNNTHRLAFKTDSGAYTTNVVTSTEQPGNAGAFTKITIPESQPTGFRYYCVTHGNAMGNTITVVEDPIKGVADVASNVTTVAGALTNVNTVAGSIANVNTVGGSINNVNTFVNVYSISAGAPSSPDAGDLWFDTSTNQLKNYNGSAWLAITASSGIQNVVDDATPQLGGALDGQNNNLNNIGTIDGTNLQLDFGTI